MNEQPIKQAIAITTKGQVMQVGLPRPADLEYDFIKKFIGETPEPWEVYLTEFPEIVWSMPESKKYYEQPINPVATMIIRSMYQNQVDAVRGNVLITGIGGSNGAVETIAPENMKKLLAQGYALKEFFNTINTMEMEY
jgi:hypothetical protein